MILVAGPVGWRDNPSGGEALGPCNRTSTGSLSLRRPALDLFSPPLPTFPSLHTRPKSLPPPSPSTTINNPELPSHLTIGLFPSIIFCLTVHQKTKPHSPLTAFSLPFEFRIAEAAEADPPICTRLLSFLQSTTRCTLPAPLLPALQKSDT